MRLKTPGPEICRQLQPASFRLKLLPILRTTVYFFSARFVRGSFVPLLFNLFRRPCLLLVFKQKNSSANN